MMNSTKASSLQPRLSPVLTSPLSSSELVSNRSSNTSPLVGLSVTWIRKLSSMHCKSLLDCLQLAVALFQQMSDIRPTRAELSQELTAQSFESCHVLQRRNPELPRSAMQKAVVV
ncbi:hypothetical protein QYF61_005238 [Mycteria americana]|uniref:Uncharacterized protein n=1 Tax=Mycteria americana TaxID=33587 RepID=A0AAN7NSA0_MYCAM|nr:hypothetical protein QYF61_005238 [Mycteria americana]